jgi:hypothetical protein
MEEEKLRFFCGLCVEDNEKETALMEEKGMENLKDPLICKYHPGNIINTKDKKGEEITIWSCCKSKDKIKCFRIS